MTTTAERTRTSTDTARVYAEEAFVIEVMEEVAGWMEREKVSKAALAKLLGTSRANVTQMLAGRNVSLRTLAATAFALGAVPKITLSRENQCGDVGEVVDLLQPRSRGPQWARGGYEIRPAGTKGAG